MTALLLLQLAVLPADRESRRVLARCRGAVCRRRAASHRRSSRDRGTETAGQVHALTEVGIDPSRMFVDKRSGATTDRPGSRAALACAREGDVLVVHTLDRLGRTVRNTLDLIHDLSARGVGVKNLADPITVDSSDPGDPVAQLSVVVLALFAQTERTCTAERAAHARSVATAKGRRVGRPVLADLDEVAWAVHLRAQGGTIAEIVKTGIARTSPHRHVPPRPVETHTVEGLVAQDPVPEPAGEKTGGRRSGGRAAARSAITSL